MDNIKDRNYARAILQRRAEDARIRARYQPTLEQQDQELLEAMRLENHLKDPFFQEVIDSEPMHAILASGN